MAKKDTPTPQKYETLAEAIKACGGPCDGQEVWDAAMKAGTKILEDLAKQGAHELAKELAKVKDLVDSGMSDIEMARAAARAEMTACFAGLIAYGKLSESINERVLKETELKIKRLEYKDGGFADECGFQDWDNRRDWLLAEISKESKTDKHRNFMLSALVVYSSKKSRKKKRFKGMGIPGTEFFDLAEELGYEIPFDAESASGGEGFFWHWQCMKIFTHPPYAKNRK